MLRQWARTSRCIAFCNEAFRAYSSLFAKAAKLFQASLTGRLLQKLGYKIKGYSRASLLSAFFRNFQAIFLAIMGNSKAVGKAISLLKANRQRFADYSKTSRVRAVTIETKADFYLMPVRAGCSLMVALLASNIALSIIIKSKIGPLGWIMRILILFITMAGLFSRVDWETLKTRSMFLRFIKII